MDIFWDFALRLFVAGAMGVLIGLEREYRAKEAGYRTHFLVALGSALMMIVSQYGFMEVLKTDLIRLDPSRIAAQVVSGIGFIGAGTIILQKQIVRGLTTAAGIWATSGIGLAVGAGMYAVGISATLLVLLGLETLSYFFKSIGLRNMMIDFFTDDKEVIKRVSKKFNTRNYVVVSYEMTEAYTNGKNVYHVSMVVKAKRMNEEGLLLMFLQDFPDDTPHPPQLAAFPCKGYFPSACVPHALLFFQNCSPPSPSPPPHSKKSLPAHYSGPASYKKTGKPFRLPRPDHILPSLHQIPLFSSLLIF